MPRLDMAVVQQGFAPSRQRAKGLIQRGQIAVNGKICTKPAYAVAAEDVVTLEGTDIPYVGRGGLKLEHALVCAKISLVGSICMDIGASTGGFTDCMLQHGAKKVYAIDVGHDQLAPVLREDPRVVSWEGMDIRQVTPSQLQEPIDFFSMDVSFISLRHVLPSVVKLLQSGAAGAVLIKPQFEVGREHVGKNGLVTDPKAHRQVLQQILQLFQTLDLSLRLLTPSPIQGGSGNVEYLAVVEKGGVPSELPDFPAVVAAAMAQRKKEKTI